MDLVFAWMPLRPLKSTQLLKTTHGDEPLKVDTGVLHPLPRWAPERHREIRKKEKNDGTGQRVNVPVRKWRTAIRWSRTVSTSEIL